MNEVDLIVVNAKVTTLQHPGAEAEAFAVRDEKFVAVGAEADVLALQGERNGGRRRRRASGGPGTQ